MAAKAAFAVIAATFLLAATGASAAALKASEEEDDRILSSSVVTSVSVVMDEGAYLADPLGRPQPSKSSSSSDIASPAALARPDKFEFWAWSPEGGLRRQPLKPSQLLAAPSFYHSEPSSSMAAAEVVASVGAVVEAARRRPPPPPPVKNSEISKPGVASWNNVIGWGSNSDTKNTTPEPTITTYRPSTTSKLSILTTSTVTNDIQKKSNSSSLLQSSTSNSSTEKASLTTQYVVSTTIGTENLPSETITTEKTSPTTILTEKTLPTIKETETTSQTIPIEKTLPTTISTTLKTTTTTDIPLTIKTTTTEKPLTIKTTTTEKPLTIKTTTTEKPLTIKTTTTEKPLTIKTTTTEKPLTIKTTTTEKPLTIKTTTTEKPLTIKTTTTEKPLTIKTTTTEKPLTIKTTTTEKPLTIKTTTTEKPLTIKTTTETPLSISSLTVTDKIIPTTTTTTEILSTIIKDDSKYTLSNSTLTQSDFKTSESPLIVNTEKLTEVENLPISTESISSNPTEEELTLETTAINQINFNNTTLYSENENLESVSENNLDEKLNNISKISSTSGEMFGDEPAPIEAMQPTITTSKEEDPTETNWGTSTSKSETIITSTQIPITISSELPTTVKTDVTNDENSEILSDDFENENDNEDINNDSQTSTAPKQNYQSSTVHQQESTTEITTSKNILENSSTNINKIETLTETESPLDQTTVPDMTNDSEKSEISLSTVTETFSSSSPESITVELNNFEANDVNKLSSTQKINHEEIIDSEYESTEKLLETTEQPSLGTTDKITTIINTFSSIYESDKLEDYSTTNSPIDSYIDSKEKYDSTDKLADIKNEPQKIFEENISTMDSIKENEHTSTDISLDLSEENTLNKLDDNIIIAAESNLASISNTESITPNYEETTIYNDKETTTEDSVKTTNNLILNPSSQTSTENVLTQEYVSTTIVPEKLLLNENEKDIITTEEAMSSENYNYTSTPYYTTLDILETTIHENITSSEEDMAEIQTWQLLENDDIIINSTTPLWEYINNNLNSNTSLEEKLDSTTTISTLLDKFNSTEVLTTYPPIEQSESFDESSSSIEIKDWQLSENSKDKENNFLETDPALALLNSNQLSDTWVIVGNASDSDIIHLTVSPPQIPESDALINLNSPDNKSTSIQWELIGSTEATTTTIDNDENSSEKNQDLKKKLKKTEEEEKTTESFEDVEYTTDNSSPTFEENQDDDEENHTEEYTSTIKDLEELPNIITSTQEAITSSINEGLSDELVKNDNSNSKNEMSTIINMEITKEANTMSQEDLAIPTTIPPEPAIALDYPGDAPAAAEETDAYKFAELCNELAWRIWRSLDVTSNKNKSLVFSPFAATSQLALLFLGARGPTSGQMNNLLGLDDVHTFNPHAVFRETTNLITSAGPKQGVTRAAFVRQLYTDKDQGKLLEFYKNQAQLFYQADVSELSASEWPTSLPNLLHTSTKASISEQTGGSLSSLKTKEFLPLSPPLASFSASLLHGSCGSFSTNGDDGVMYVPSTIESERRRRLMAIPALVLKSGFYVGRDEGIQATVVSLQAPNSDISTVLVTPWGDGSLQELESRLFGPDYRQGAWRRLLRSLKSRPDLELQIPRVHQTSEVNATSLLLRLGLRDLLDSSKADLRGLSAATATSRPLYLSDAVFLAEFEACSEDSPVLEPVPLRAKKLQTLDLEPIPLRFRERSTVNPPSPVAIRRLRFDRPFIYVVRHNRSGFVLFIGRYYPA